MTLQEIFILNSKALIVLLIFAGLDIVSGVISAILSKSLKSSVFREGLLKKILEIIICIIAIFCDWLFNVSIVGAAVITALVVMEAYSILENINNYVPVPEQLKDFLNSTKEHKQ